MGLRLTAISLKSILGDCCGGFIAALIALPYGLAMASLMGLPPLLGVFSSLLTAPITALIGRNPVLIGGTSSVTVPIIALAARQQGVGGAAKVTLVGAVFMLTFSVLRWGRFISKVPHAVVSGFSCGIGAMMFISQLKSIFGLRISIDGATASLVQLLRVLQHIAETRWQPLVLGAIVIAVGLGVTRLTAKAPAPLLGVLAAAFAARILGLHEIEIGSLPLDMPPFAGFTWSAADIYQVLPAGFALAFVASINLLITSRVVDHFRTRHKPMKGADADRELGAYGIANVCAGLFGAPMSVGIPARSLAAVRCGATTRLSNLAHAGVLVACLTWGANYVSHIPVTALAGVTAYVGICLLEWGTWRRLAKMRRADASAFLLTASLTLMVNAIAAVAAGCAVYLFVWLAHRARLHGWSRLNAVPAAE